MQFIKYSQNIKGIIWGNITVVTLLFAVSWAASSVLAIARISLVSSGAGGPTISLKPAKMVTVSLGSRLSS